jgi:hypothetical protein
MRMCLKKGSRMWAGFIWPRIESCQGFCEHGNEPAGSIKGEEYLD